MIRPVMRCLAAARRRCSWTRTYYQTLLSRSLTKGLQPLVSTKNARIDSRQFYRLEFRRNAFESVVSSEVCTRPLTRRSKLVSLSTDVKRYSLYAFSRISANEWLLFKYLRTCWIPRTTVPWLEILFAWNYGVMWNSLPDSDSTFKIVPVRFFLFLMSEKL